MPQTPALWAVSPRSAGWTSCTSWRPARSPWRGAPAGAARRRRGPSRRTAAQVSVGACVWARVGACVWSHVGACVRTCVRACGRVRVVTCGRVWARVVACVVGCLASRPPVPRGCAVACGGTFSSLPPHSMGASCARLSFRRPAWCAGVDATQGPRQWRRSSELESLR